MQLQTIESLQEHAILWAESSAQLLAYTNMHGFADTAPPKGTAPERKPAKGEGDRRGKKPQSTVNSASSFAQGQQRPAKSSCSSRPERLPYDAYVWLSIGRQQRNARSAPYQLTPQQRQQAQQVSNN